MWAPMCSGFAAMSLLGHVSEEDLLPLLRDLLVLFLFVYQCLSFVNYMCIVHVHRIFVSPMVSVFVFASRRQMRV